jgi:hypothetical protein
MLALNLDPRYLIQVARITDTSHQCPANHLLMSVWMDGSQVTTQVHVFFFLIHSCLAPVPAGIQQLFIHQTVISHKGIVLQNKCIVKNGIFYMKCVVGENPTQ